MTYEIDLRSAWAKLRHAEHQRDSLNALIGSFSADPDSRIQLAAELEPASGFHIIRIKHLPDLDPLSERVSLGVGDVLNNLRNALDHLAWQLAQSFANGRPAHPRRVYFPICDSRARHLDPEYLDPVVWSRMHDFQPCKGRNGRPDNWSGEYIHQLSLLRALSNEDKHRHLGFIRWDLGPFSTLATRTPWIIRTADGLTFAPEKLSEHDPDAEEISFVYASKHVEVNAEVVRIRAAAWADMPEIANVGEMTPRFALDDNRPVIPTLSRLAEFVRLIFTDLEPG